ncbi:MAG: hypothetical protein Q9225_004674 [Loekoesia sp. 1 TL-2023]
MNTHSLVFVHDLPTGATRPADWPALASPDAASPAQITAPFHPSYHVRPNATPHFEDPIDIQWRHITNYVDKMRERRDIRHAYDRTNRHFNPLCLGGKTWRLPPAPTKEDMLVKRIVKQKLEERKEKRMRRLMNRGVRETEKGGLEMDRGKVVWITVTELDIQIEELKMKRNVLVEDVREEKKKMGLRSYE